MSAREKPLEQPPLSVPPPAQSQPVAASQHDWDMLSPEVQASILFSWSEFWFRQTPAVAPMASMPIVLPIPSTDGETSSTVGWKQSPSADEREAMRDGNWK